MITPMHKITICGINSQRNLVMKRLQNTGCVEIIKDTEPETETVNVSDKIAGVERYLSVYKKALEILDKYSPAKTAPFFSRKDILVKSLDVDLAEMEETFSIAEKIINTDKIIKDNTSGIGSINTHVASLNQWISLDISLAFEGTKYTEFDLYTYPNSLDYNNIKNLLKPKEDYLAFEIVSKSKEITCVFVIYLKDHKEEIVSLLRDTGFVKVQLETHKQSPKEVIVNLNEKLKNMYDEIESAKKKIISYVSNRDKMRLLYDKLILKRDRYKALESINYTEETFIIEGFVPRTMVGFIENKLSDLMCTIDFSEVKRDEAPVMFKNNAFVSAVEGITSSYSMPSAKDIDPNAIMSIFYYLFFGMMFSDAGYGLLMTLVCAFFAFKAKVHSGLKRNMRMFFFCGLSTMFWGFMYGSFFGDIVPNLRPIWINPIEEPLTLLIFSVALGIVQIVIGLILKFYVDYRAGNKTSAVFDTLSWIIMLIGIVVAIIGVVLKISILTSIGVVFSLFGAFVVIIMKERTTRNPFKRLLSGILALYDITSYISDFLSYSRLMALGLATGVIANVVNIMSGLVGGGIAGSIAFVIIFIFGHTLNFAINILGAYVHTNRLQYVEFYSKFYEGGGRAFSPLKMNTQYYNFMEVEKQ